MEHIVKTMVDGLANDVKVEAEDHKQAVIKLYEQLTEKNEKRLMMSEEIKIFSKCGLVEHTIKNLLC
jgi:hypothetical protein